MHTDFNNSTNSICQLSYLCLSMFTRGFFFRRFLGVGFLVGVMLNQLA